MKISYSQVEEYANEIHYIANNMKEILDRVNASYASVNNGLWNGKASDDFNSKIVKLIKNFDEMYNELEMCVLYMANCSDGYKSMDQKILNEICNNLNILEPSYESSKIFSGV